MRFMMFMYPEISEAEWEPSAEGVAEMSRYNEELRKAGMLLSLDGLHPPGEGARTRRVEAPFRPRRSARRQTWLWRRAGKSEVVVVPGGPAFPATRASLAFFWNRP